MTEQYNAWNPGLESSIPGKLRSSVTLFRPENAFVDYDEARELADLTGLPALDLIALRPERLVMHELLIRVSADLSVPDGPNYEVLGINLRSMVTEVLDGFVDSEMKSIVHAFEQAKREARVLIEKQLDEWIFGAAADDNATAATDPLPAAAPAAGSKSSTTPLTWLRHLFGGDRSESQVVSEPRDRSVTERSAPGLSTDRPELVALEHWQRELARRDDVLSPTHAQCLEALVKVIGVMIGHRDRLVADRELISRLVVNRVANSLGAQVISERIEPLFARAVEVSGYRRLPAQENPVIMNVKGASASGKSTIRPQQRELAAKLGIPWEDFALISPDYWRKYLLDYTSLGEHCKYGAMLTGQELEIIDRKLDRYMAEKAKSGRMSHLLIDRFRFDSFQLSQDRTADSRLLTRFGDRIYLFFMVTPPAETVARAWSRGLSTGRFKAVDDLLYHNVEAFTGMPSLFLSWINASDKAIHVEFLDNDVPKGELPRTAAIGWNGSLTILDVNCMINIDRFRKVNVDARTPEEIFKAEDLKTSNNLKFMRTCIESIDEVQFADQKTGQVYALVVQGTLRWWNRSTVESSKFDPVVKEVLEAFGYAGQECRTESAPPTLDCARERLVTVGQWSAR